jgi:pyruvate, orthophosphate dikinase
LPLDPTEADITAAVVALDPQRRLGASTDPLFLSVGLAAIHSSDRVGQLRPVGKARRLGRVQYGQRPDLAPPARTGDGVLGAVAEGWSGIAEPQIPFLGLTPASEAWLTAAAGPEFVRARRTDLGQALSQVWRTSLGQAPSQARRTGPSATPSQAQQLDRADEITVPCDPLEQVVAAVGSLTLLAPAMPTVLTVMPCAVGAGSGSGVAVASSDRADSQLLQGRFRPRATGAELLLRGGEDLAVVAARKPWGEQLAAAAATAVARMDGPVQVEFVVERGRLWLLTVRAVPRRGAALVSAVAARGRRGDLAGGEALELINERDLAMALAPANVVEGLPVVARGLGASAGVVSGEAVFSAADAVAAASVGRDAVLILPESKPEDLPGLLAARAIVTMHGGYTAHAAVVARGLGLVCVTALSDAVVDLVPPGLCPANRSAPAISSR